MDCSTEFILPIRERGFDLPNHLPAHHLSIAGAQYVVAGTTDIMALVRMSGRKEQLPLLATWRDGDLPPGGQQTTHLRFLARIHPVTWQQIGAIHSSRLGGHLDDLTSRDGSPDDPLGIELAVCRVQSIDPAR